MDIRGFANSSSAARHAACWHARRCRCCCRTDAGAECAGPAKTAFAATNSLLHSLKSSGRKRMARFRLYRACLLVAALWPFGATMAQDYPTRPITLIVPFAAGGSSDVNARLIAERMSQQLGQPIVIENIGGAGGAVALARVAQAP